MPIRVLVVEDSQTVRARIVEALSRDPGLRVVGVAEDGKRAIEQCERLAPDVITLDMMLPEMTGLAVTEYVMAYRPTPILIVSASVNRGELFRTYEALAAGAIDVLDKPRGDETDDGWDRKLVATVKLISRIKVITHPRGRLAGIARTPAPGPLDVPPPARTPRLVAIGGSTGAPGALLEILQALPSDYPLPLLVVIHLGDPFALAFADWLDGESPLRVAYACDGEPLPPVGSGRVLMAPPGQHLVLRGGRLWLNLDPPRHFCRPSVDALFESVAAEMGSTAIACLLTGMGRDGAQGLAAIRRAGGSTIAQDEQTSVVYGMPRQAVEMGAAERVLPLGAIGPTLNALGARWEKRVIR